MIEILYITNTEYYNILIITVLLDFYFKRDYKKQKTKR